MAASRIGCRRYRPLGDAANPYMNIQLPIPVSQVTEWVSGAAVLFPSRCATSRWVDSEPRIFHVWKRM